MVPSIVFILVMLYGNLLFFHQLLMAVQFEYHLPMQEYHIWHKKLVIEDYLDLNVIGFSCILMPKKVLSE
jgi:hypothetical protein